MKKFLMTTLALASISASVIAEPLPAEFNFTDRLNRDCLFDGCVFSRAEAEELLENFEALSATREQMVRAEIPAITAKLEKVGSDYQKALSNPNIHPKSKEILSALLDSGPIGNRLQESLSLAKEADQTYLRLQEITMSKFKKWLNAMIELEVKPQTIQDEEVRRMYITQKKIEILRITNQVYLARVEVTFFGYDFFVNQYSEDEEHRITLPLPENEDCRSVLDGLSVDGRKDHLKVLQILVGDGTRKPVSLQCHRSTSPNAAKYLPKDRVLRIPFKKHRPDFFGNVHISYPRMDQMLSVIGN